MICSLFKVFGTQQCQNLKLYQRNQFCLTFTLTDLNSDLNVRQLLQKQI